MKVEIEIEKDFFENLCMYQADKKAHQEKLKLTEQQSDKKEIESKKDV